MSRDAWQFLNDAVEAHLKGILERAIELSKLRLDVQRYSQR